MGETERAVAEIDHVEQLRALEDLRAGAIVAADRAILDAMTSNDYFHVDTTGRTRSKAEFLDGLEDDRARFVSYRLLANGIRILGSAAIVTGSFENALRAPDGTIVVKRARHVRVYARGSEGWSNVLHQATALD